jgi:hypothetical protein
VDVTLLFFPDCPNWRLADERLREALARAGRDDVRVQHRQVTTAEHAEAAGFRGSPTVLIDGLDPFADPDAPAGLSCRSTAPTRGWSGRRRSSSYSRSCSEASRPPVLSKRAVGDLQLLRAGPAPHRRPRARGDSWCLRVLALRAWMAARIARRR